MIQMLLLNIDMDDTYKNRGNPNKKSKIIQIKKVQY